MIELLKRALGVLLKVLEWVPGWRKAREKRALRKAIAEHDEAKMNRIFQQRRDRK